MTEKRICEVCGKPYKTCRSCEETYSKVYYTWRSHYCSSACCMIGFNNLESGGYGMKLQAKGLTYDLKEYDLNKNIYVASNDKVIEYEDIECFMFTKEEFEKAFNKVVKATK